METKEDTTAVNGLEEKNAFLSNEGKDYDTQIANDDGRPKPVGRLTRLKKDIIFRRRIIHTGCLCFSFVALGWGAGMSGPAFPDIRLIIDKDLETSSWFLSVGSIGYLIGSLVGGVLYDQFNKELLLFISLIGMSVSTVVIPWITNFPLILAVRTVSLICCGALDTGGNADILHVWGSESGPYMQALHFAFSFGALLAPFATEPFLAEKYCKPQTFHDQRLSDNNFTSRQMSNVLQIDNFSYQQNITSATNMEGLYNSTDCKTEYDETKVHYAFLISGIFYFISAICYLVLYFWAKSVGSYNAGDQYKKREKTSADEKKNTPRPLSLKQRVLFLVLLALLLMLYCLCEDGFVTFLMTFGLEYLQWDKLKGSLASGMFWIAFGVGRFCGIFVVHCCKQVVVLSVALPILVISYVGFYIGAVLYIEPMIWIFTCLLGLFKSVIFPSIFSWTSENIVEVTGKVSALFMVTVCLGNLGFPLLMGFTMENYSPMWFVYIILFTISLTTALFFTILIMKKLLIPRSNPSEEDEGTSQEMETMS